MTQRSRDTPALVLGIFKGHERLRLPPERAVLVERQGFMQTEDGDYPCWNNAQPLPKGRKPSPSWCGTLTCTDSFS